MVDFREFKDVIKEAVTKESECDGNWKWTVRSIGKKAVKIDWGYTSKYLGEEPFVLTSFGEEFDCEMDGLKMSDPRGHKEYVSIGDSYLEDCSNYGDGIGRIIHVMGMSARNVW